jgi:repressor LexA
MPDFAIDKYFHRYCGGRINRPPSSQQRPAPLFPQSATLSFSRLGANISTTLKIHDNTMHNLTPRQAEILAFIQDTQARSGMPPTRAEIAGHFDFSSTFAAGKHLQALARKGVIELLPGASRGIRLVQTRPTGLPLVGRVAAGAPVLAEENIEDHVSIGLELFRPQADYLLRVHGMSMKDIGIFDGDLLAVHRTPQADNGQVVVARLDGEVTVKRFQRDGDLVTLLPENSDFEPITIDAGMWDFSIEGIVVGCIRTRFNP